MTLHSLVPRTCTPTSPNKPELMAAIIACPPSPSSWQPARPSLRRLGDSSSAEITALTPSLSRVRTEGGGVLSLFHRMLAWELVAKYATLWNTAILSFICTKRLARCISTPRRCGLKGALTTHCAVLYCSCWHKPKTRNRDSRCWGARSFYTARKTA